MKHTKTDPVCIKYKETGPFRHYLNERGRGKACLVCVPTVQPADSASSQLVKMAERLEFLIKAGLDGDERLRADVEAKSYRTASAIIQKAAVPSLDERADVWDEGWGAPGYATNPYRSAK